MKGGVVEMSFGRPLKDASDDEAPPSKPPSMAFMSAADDLFDAVKADNRAKFADALHAAFSICASDDEGEGDEAESDEGSSDTGY